MPLHRFVHKNRLHRKSVLPDLRYVKTVYVLAQATSFLKIPGR